MKIAVFGKTGQVATELGRRGKVRLIGRDEADLSDAIALGAFARSLEADAIINAAAFTAVDRAEDEEALATRINGEAPGVLAEVAAAKAIPLIQISTDYVFDGQGTAPRRPSDATGPLGAYGRSKLDGERRVMAAGGSHAILRTSWVFSAHGANFVKTMLRLSETRDSLSVVADQIGGPTPAAAIADACLTLAELLARGATGGTYHYSGAPDVSWADFAREIFRQAGREVMVTDIAASEYPTPAKRPANSRLDCALLRKDHGIERPDWREGLADVLKELNT